MVGDKGVGNHINLEDREGMTFRALLHENKLLEVVVWGEFNPLLLQQIVRYVERTIEDVGPLAGLMLDLRQSNAVSIVRATALVETLSDFITPMAVVFIWHQQHQIAQLMHHTLPRRGEIGYFTHHTDAWTYLLRRTDQDSTR